MDAAGKWALVISALRILAGVGWSVLRLSFRLQPMSEHKRDPSLGKRHLKNFILLGIPFALACIAALYALRHQRIDWFITFFIAGLGIAIVGLVRQERLFRN